MVGGRTPCLIIRAQAIASTPPDPLAVDRRPALPGVLVLFKDQDAGPLAEDEPVAVLVERPAGPGRLVVSLRQSPAGDEPAQAHRGDCRLGPAGDHHVRVVPLD